MMHNYPKQRKSRAYSSHEPKVKCPECDYVSIEKVVRVHHERWHILRPLRQLLFNNPCIACKAQHKPIEKLTLSTYSELCMSHREIYDDWKNTLQTIGSGDKN